MSTRPDYSSAIRVMMHHNGINQTDVGIQLDITPQAAGAKFKKNAFNEKDIKILNEYFKVNLSEVARRLAKNEPPMDVVAEEMAEYGKPADYTITLNAEEAKQIMLNLSKTNAQLVEEMNNLKSQFADLLRKLDRD